MVNNLTDTGRRRHSSSPTGGRVLRLRLHTVLCMDGNEMATDYDAPRKQDEELKEDSIEELKSRRGGQQSASVDEDEAVAAESFELPGADLSHEELSVVVLPAQEDEFTCGSCFQVRHRSQVAEERNGLKICVECAG